MIDLHCHILPGVDDGARTLEESLAMARIAAGDGITDLVATPHYIEGETTLRAAELIQNLEDLKKRLAEEHIPLRLHPGHEIHIGPEVPDLLEREEILSLAGSRYVLVELPFFELPLYAESVLHTLRLSGKVPVLAHPERNRLLEENPNRLLDFLELGVLAQINAGSLLGRNGKPVRKAAEILLTHGMVHFVASDGHHQDQRRPRLSQARKAAARLIGAREAEKLFESNPARVLADEPIEAEVPARYKKKKSIFHLF